MLGTDMNRKISKMEKVTSLSKITVHVLLLSAFRVSSVRKKRIVGIENVQRTSIATRGAAKA